MLTILNIFVIKDSNETVLSKYIWKLKENNNKGFKINR
jgi:hypothetical protein